MNNVVNKVKTLAVKPKQPARRARAAAADATTLQFFIDSLTCNKKSELGNGVYQPRELL